MDAAEAMNDTEDLVSETCYTADLEDGAVGAMADIGSDQNNGLADTRVRLTLFRTYDRNDLSNDPVLALTLEGDCSGMSIGTKKWPVGHLMFLMDEFGVIDLRDALTDWIDTFVGKNHDLPEVRRHD